MTLAPAGRYRQGRPTVKALSTSAIAEKVDGKKVEGDDGRGDAGTGTGRARRISFIYLMFGYVLLEEYKWAIDDNPAKTLKVGGHVLRAHRLPASGVQA